MIVFVMQKQSERGACYPGTHRGAQGSPERGGTEEDDTRPPHQRTGCIHHPHELCDAEEHRHLRQV